MTALDAWRRTQHDDAYYTSDAAFHIFLASRHPDEVALDRIAHASPEELHMLRRWTD